MLSMYKYKWLSLYSQWMPCPRIKHSWQGRHNNDKNNDNTRKKNKDTKRIASKTRIHNSGNSNLRCSSSGCCKKFRNKTTEKSVLGWSTLVTQVRDVLPELYWKRPDDGFYPEIFCNFIINNILNTRFRWLSLKFGTKQ